MKRPDVDQRDREPLVEIASDETVLRALAQSAHPVEFIASNEAGDETAERREP